MGISKQQEREQDRRPETQTGTEIFAGQKLLCHHAFSFFFFLISFSRISVRFMALIGESNQEQGCATGISRGARFLLTGMLNRKMRRLRMLIDPRGIHHRQPCTRFPREDKVGRPAAVGLQPMTF